METTLSPGNEYGSLTVKQEGGKFFWSVEDYGGHDWKEITKELYDELIKFHNSTLDK